MVTLIYQGKVVQCADGIRRLQVENKSYPGQTFSGEDLDLIFKMFPDSPMLVTFEIGTPNVPLESR